MIVVLLWLGLLPMHVLGVSAPTVDALQHLMALGGGAP
jgi:hypothetical protein